MTDWPPRIIELIRVKERIAAVDVQAIFPFTIPAVAPSPAALEAVGVGTGLVLDPGHLGFLQAADGWRAFFEAQDLLNTEQLVGGDHRDAFSAWIDTAPPQARAAGFSSATLLPIAVDLTMPLFAAMPIADGHVTSQVLTMDPSGLLDTFDSFEEYFDANVATTRLHLAHLEPDAPGGGVEVGPGVAQDPPDWRTNVSPHVMNDLQRLTDMALKVAHARLVEKGHLAPFALAVGAGGEVVEVVDDEDPDADLVVVARGLRSEIRAVAFVGSTRDADHGPDQVTVQLEHRDGTAVAKHQRYELMDGEIAVAPPTEGAGLHRLWHVPGDRGVTMTHLHGYSDPVDVSLLPPLVEELDDPDAEYVGSGVSVEEPFGWSVHADPSGTVILDHDDEDETFLLQDVSREETVAIMTDLAHGDIDAVRSRAWTVA